MQHISPSPRFATPWLARPTGVGLAAWSLAIATVVGLAPVARSQVYCDQSCSGDVGPVGVSGYAPDPYGVPPYSSYGSPYGVTPYESWPTPSYLRPNQIPAIAPPPRLAGLWNSWIGQARAAEGAGDYSAAAFFYGQAWQAIGQAEDGLTRTCLQAEANARAEAARSAQSYLSRVGVNPAAQQEARRRRQQVYTRELNRLLGSADQARCS